MNRLIAVAVLSALLATGLLAATGSMTPQSPASSPPEKGLSKRGPSGASQPLGRNLRLTFQAKGSELPPLSVVAASTAYGIEVQFAGGQGLTHVEISGEIHPVEGASDRFLVHYRVAIGHDGNENAVSLYGHGSANATIGKSITLMDVAGKPLMLELAEAK